MRAVAAAALGLSVLAVPLPQRAVATGATLVRDDVQVMDESYVGPPAVMHGIYYFSGNPGGALWRSDGTAAGTYKVADLYPREIRAVGNTLYISVDDGVHGNQLWKSDGTAAGTTVVKDIHLGPDDSLGPRDFTPVGDTVFFTADDGVHGRELWATDGTTAGTRMVKDIGNKAIAAPIFGRRFEPPTELTAAGGKLFFFADATVHGRQLWTSDGTEAGTNIVKVINPINNFFVDTFMAMEDYNRDHSMQYDLPAPPADMVAMGNTVYFAADDLVHGRELWRSDGTDAGTTMVKDINTNLHVLPDRYVIGETRGTASSNPVGLSVAGNTLYFGATDGTNYGLWKSDGTAVGTTFVKRGVYPRNGVDVRGQLLFNPAVGGPLWRTDGTDAGTYQLTARGSSQPITTLRGTAFFASSDSTHGTELWSTDGTPIGTGLVQDLDPGPAGSYPRQMADVKGTLFFAADEDAFHVGPRSAPGSDRGLTASKPSPLGFRPIDGLRPTPARVHRPSVLARPRRMRRGGRRPSEAKGRMRMRSTTLVVRDGRVASGLRLAGGDLRQAGAQ
jgi:ELWxxDGT repeat protein